MGKGTVSSKFLVILNIINTLLGMGLIGLSAWLCIEIAKLTNLRNPNHFALEKKIYWTQGLPWTYAAAGGFTVLTSCCAFLGAAKRSRAVLLTHVIFQILAVLALSGVAALTLLMADTETSDEFISKTLTDAFYHMQDERGEEVKKGFGLLEMRLECCGPNKAVSYKKLTGLYDINLPVSCCNSFSSEVQVEVCRADDALANSRPGCIDVVNLYARMIMKCFAGAAVLTAFIGFLNLIFAFCLFTSIMQNKKSRPESVSQLSRRYMNECEQEKKIPL